MTSFLSYCLSDLQTWSADSKEKEKEEFIMKWVTGSMYSGESSVLPSTVLGFVSTHLLTPKHRM
jgi:hypothetical protein